MSRGAWKAGLALTLLLDACPSRASNGFKSIAKELSSAAKGARITRIAVLPFTPADESSPQEGWGISEKLITQMVRTGKVQAVERSLLRDLLDEHRLARTGMLDPTMLKKIGRVASAEGVVTGSFVSFGGEVIVNARLIDVETGVIIAAVERHAEREWFDTFSPAPPSARLASFWVPVPELDVAVPSLDGQDSAELRDSPADASCAEAPERVDKLESQILDLKARYWALQLKNGLSNTSLKQNPGSTITDPILRKEFYDRMRAWYDQGAIPELTPAEVRRFVDIDQKAFSLYRDCGL